MRCFTAAHLTDDDAWEEQGHFYEPGKRTGHKQYSSFVWHTVEFRLSRAEFGCK